ncbi:zinc finger FYVE domain-containing protein 16-like protein [Dinothrombium tinctorium]|uniref:Zinc finger FYVE domain-containing protein 16-like protein n=1 Tax=Dinothrombium tinctorium TaxID=1965070 RepID=A0A3S3QE48_9ACAR|nr:zinc finger FYVE domain-containing protein 16-like protein [Dinothrombium tinctorium]
MDKFLVDFDLVLDQLEAEEMLDGHHSPADVSLKRTPANDACADLNNCVNNCVQNSDEKRSSNEAIVESVDLSKQESQDASSENDRSLCSQIETDCIQSTLETVDELALLASDRDINAQHTESCDTSKCNLTPNGENCDKKDEALTNDESSSVKCDTNNPIRFGDCVVTNLTEEEIHTYLSDIEEQIIDKENDNETNGEVKFSEGLNCDNTVDAGDVLNNDNEEVNKYATRPSSLMLPNFYSNNEEPLPNADTCDSPSENIPENNVQNSVLEEDFVVGKYKPFWIPDNDAPSCMSCDTKFTVIKRRHHCRACGKVLCSQCCNSKAKLPYLSNKEARVCSVCLPLLSNVEDENSHANTSSNAIESTANVSTSGNRSYPNSPNPNNPSEYCSSIPPLEQAEAAIYRPPPTVFVPVGVLKRGNKPKGEPKQVVFSDGIRPGSDLSETDSDFVPPFPVKGRQLKRLKSPSLDKNSLLTASLKLPRTKSNRITVIDSNGPLPPIINCPQLQTEATPEKLLQLLQDDESSPVCFYLTKNLHVNVKLVSLDCCMQNTCWLFSSKGLSSVGQDEIIVALEKFSDEVLVPRDIFRLLTSVYDYASRGSPFSEMSHILFTEGLFENKDNNGFIFIRPTFQCIKKFLLPSPPYLVAILLHKCEIPWAKIFPLRLLLRLGAEYRYYPCPLISYRNRKSAYFEIGHTIMNVLADFRNFQYTLPCIPGLVIHIEEKKTKVNFPRNRYDQVMKALSSSNEHVLAFAANFSSEADSHLTCVQNDDGQYQTQTINLQGSSRTITGASFIVFSGALKSSTGLSAKMSIVEDGLLVQIPSNTMEELRTALREMQDFTIRCGKIDVEENNDFIYLLWTKDDKNFNIGVRSLIDGMSLEGVQNVRIYNGTDYAGDKYFIRWTEVFFIQNEENTRRSDSVDPTRLAGIVAQSLCLALTPHLEHLVDNNFVKISLRVTLDPEKVGYDVGSNGNPLPAAYVNELDGALIPVIMGSVAANVESLLVMELVFHILVK